MTKSAKITPGCLVVAQFHILGERRGFCAGAFERFAEKGATLLVCEVPPAPSDRLLVANLSNLADEFWVWRVEVALEDDRANQGVQNAA